jgi:hypothetical protein
MFMQHVAERNMAFVMKKKKTGFGQKQVIV